ncbi:ABC transporter permease [Snodgrassella gandavensis]|uniref:ABC transporter permease n=1 Tax=Snodgrassella gandavensis TaxID=2946698 RepID=UPI001EF46A1F|nr:ABC transporter permease subunit [Snodgrassella gandavensis]
MKLLINEWRKYLFSVRSVIVIPLILLIILIIYFSTMHFLVAATKPSAEDYSKVFLFGITICYNFVNFITIIYASNILSSEISRGTIKFILTRPYQRYKILLAKIGAITLLMPIFMIIAVIISLLLQLLTIHHMPELGATIKYTGIYILYILAVTVFFTAFALMLSSMTSSPAFVTGCSIVYYFCASKLWATINFLYFHLPTDGWLYKLCPLNVIDLMNDAIENSAQNEFYIALLANITYACIFVLIAVLIFRRRDISLAN